jgi:hypothetical protein
MQAKQTGVRIAAVAGAVVAVAPLAVLVAHQLLNSKPYKIVAQPLHAALAFGGVWVPLLLISLAVLVGVFIPQRLAALSPVVALAAAILVAFGSVVLLTATFGRSVPAAGDFGTNAVIAAFFSMAVQTAIPFFAFAALLGWIIRQLRSWRVAAV